MSATQPTLPALVEPWPSTRPLPFAESARRARLVIEALKAGRPIPAFAPYQGLR